jgi:hypothetical protein
MAAPKSPSSSTRPGNVTNAMTREEVIARLEAVEARSETRFVELGGKLDYLTDIMVGDHGFFAQLKSLRADTLAQISAVKTELKAEMTTLKADNRITRWTVVITLITSIMAASALILSVQANLLAAFQAGQIAAPSAHAPR